MVTVSSAKLRTRTGCLQCRKRRKKCDETWPLCAGCTRNQLPCEWPSEHQTPDRRTWPRRRQSRNLHNPVANVMKSDIRNMRLPAPVSMPSPFQLEQHCYLYRYFGSNILPRLIRQGSLARYTDQGYMLRLALEFPPLMGALVSIAGMHIASLDGSSIACAVASYVETLAGLRKVLNYIPDVGSHDALLATVVTLAVFETSRLDSTLQVAPHVMASGLLLRKRRLRHMNHPQTAAVFNRICIESFVYHASLMMIFDPSLDTLSDNHFRRDISALLSDPVHNVQKPSESDKSLMTQPILHGPYEFFLLIADVTRLARSPDPLDADQTYLWNQMQLQLFDCRRVMENGHEKCTELYFLAIQILLLKSHPGLSEAEVNHEIESSLWRGIPLIPQIKRSLYFPSFLLWPLAILGSVSTAFDEISQIREYISRVADSRLGGQASLVLSRLEGIWAFSTILEERSDFPVKPRIFGLQTLLNGTSGAGGIVDNCSHELEQAEHLGLGLGALEELPFEGASM